MYKLSNLSMSDKLQHKKTQGAKKKITKNWEKKLICGFLMAKEEFLYVRSAEPK